MNVHRELGCGFLESVYHEALGLEFEEAGIPFISEKQLEIIYKGKKLTNKFFADFVCFEEIIIELKTVDKLAKEHLAQVLNYLKATGFELGLLINFGAPSLQYKRVIL